MNSYFSYHSISGPHLRCSLKFAFGNLQICRKRWLPYARTLGLLAEILHNLETLEIE